MNPSTSPKITASGSIQSHLSIVNQRLRPSTSSGTSTSTDLSNLRKNPHDDLLQSAPTFYSGVATSKAVQNILPMISQHSDESSVLSSPSQLHQWVAICTRAVVLFYCCFSLIFTSFMVYSQMGKGYSGVPRTSPMNNLSYSQRLSRLLPFQLSASGAKLFPFFLNRTSAASLSSITLCLWEDESNTTTEAVNQLTSRWGGQVSLLLTISDPPSDHTPFLQRLETWKTHSSLSSLSVHVLQLSAHSEPYSPNAFLNLARLLAPTSTVLLFPGSLTSKLDLSYPMANLPSPEDFVFLTSTRPAIYPSNASSFTILVARDYDLWCTERSFLLNTRTAAWNECLWQFWLNSYGQFQHFNAASSNIERLESEYLANNFTKEIYEQLSSRFRTEVCDINIKKFSTSASPLSLNEAQNLRWLKQFCH